MRAPVPTSRVAPTRIAPSARSSARSSATSPASYSIARATDFPRFVLDHRVAVTGASSHAQRLAAVEESIIGEELHEATIAAAAERAAQDLEDVNADIHASEEYRREMTKVFTRRAIGEAATRA